MTPDTFHGRPRVGGAAGTVALNPEAPPHLGLSLSGGVLGPVSRGEAHTAVELVLQVHGHSRQGWGLWCPGCPKLDANLGPTRPHIQGTPHGVSDIYSCVANNPKT